jgi:hypothetical protein
VRRRKFVAAVLDTGPLDLQVAETNARHSPNTRRSRLSPANPGRPFVRGPTS